MKLLLLFLFVGCGKNQFPAYLDLTDSDGDGIPNYQEIGIERYLATPSEPSILGRMMLTGSNKGSSTDVFVSNELSSEFLRAQLYQPKPHLLDALADGRLLLPKTPKSLNLDEAEYAVEFELAGVKLSDISLTLSDGSKRIFDLRYRGTTLKKEIVLDILSGKAVIGVAAARKTEEKKKTYNVFLQSDSQAKVLKVSRELPLEEVLNHIGVRNPEDGVSEALAAHANMAEEAWILKPMGEDFFLGYMSREQIRDTYLASLKSLSGKIVRREGIAQAPLVLKKKAGEKIFLRIRPMQQLRRFREYEKNEVHLTRKMEWLPCPTMTREEIGILSDQPQISELFGWIGIDKFYDLKTLHEKGLARDLRIRNDSRGNFYELVLDIPLEDVRIHLHSLPHSNLVTVGRYYRLHPYPNVPLSTQSVSREKSLELEMEVFVEKLNRRL